VSAEGASNQREDLQWGWEAFEDDVHLPEELKKIVHGV
jgi:hypothetical protein